MNLALGLQSPFFFEAVWQTRKKLKDPTPSFFIRYSKESPTGYKHSLSKSPNVITSPLAQNEHDDHGIH